MTKRSDTLREGEGKCDLCGVVYNGTIDHHEAGWLHRRALAWSRSEPPPPVAEPRQPGLYIIFDGPPSHESGRFVEVEDENYRSVEAGEWLRYEDDDLWALGPFERKVRA